jgi:hypothetical protein
MLRLNLNFSERRVTGPVPGRAAAARRRRRRLELRVGPHAAGSDSGCIMMAANLNLKLFDTQQARAWAPPGPRPAVAITVTLETGLTRPGASGAAGPPARQTHRRRWLRGSAAAQSLRGSVRLALSCHSASPVRRPGPGGARAAGARPARRWRWPATVSRVGVGVTDS